MKERDELGVVADEIGSPTWAAGLAQTIWALVKTQATGTFHYADDGAISWYDFAVAIAEQAHAMGLLARIPAIRPRSPEHIVPRQQRHQRSFER